MAKVSGKIFDVSLFSKLMVFAKPYKATYYFVMVAAILLSVFSKSFTSTPSFIPFLRQFLHLPFKDIIISSVDLFKVNYPEAQARFFNGLRPKC